MSRWSSNVDTKAFEQEQWLGEDNEKIVICDIQYYNTTPTVDEMQVGYFSNFPYITGFGDSFTNLLGNTVSSIAYEDILINIPNIISRIDASINIGAIEFLNSDGVYDELITYAWEGHPLRIYIGGRDWLKDDFIMILEAVSTVISSPRPNIMSLGIRDKNEVLNVKAQLQFIDEDYVTALYADNAPAFIKPLDNLISVSTPIEIKITSGISQTDLALYTLIELQSKIPEVTAVATTTTKITLTQELSGSYDAAHDGYEAGDTDGSYNRNDSFDTGFTFEHQDVVPPTQISGTQYIIVENYGTAADLADKYFHIHTPYKQYYVWYNVSSTSVDPELIERQQQEFNAAVISIPDTILNTVVPICLGKCFNIEPKLIDANNHVYQVHEGQIEDIVNVRSNGVTLVPPGATGATIPQYEINKTIGCFRLLVHDNNTQITCDVIGQFERGKDANGLQQDIDIILHSAAMMVEWLSLEKTILLYDDICPFTFPEPPVIFDEDIPGFDNTDPLGLYIRDEIDIGPLINDVMASVGGYARFHRTCVLQIIRFVDPVDRPSELLIDESSVLEKGISLSATEVPKSSIVLGYDKNWTIQDKGAIAALITEDATGTLLDLYTGEYSSAIATNLNIKDKYPLAVDQELIGTFITDFVDGTNHAQDEVDRRKALRSVKRYIYKVQTTVAPFTVNLGDVITLKHKRYGFDHGRKVLVIGMEEKPTKQRVDLEVWI